MAPAYPFGHVRFTLESRHVQCASPCPLSANSGHRAHGPRTYRNRRYVLWLSAAYKPLNHSYFTPWSRSPFHLERLPLAFENDLRLILAYFVVFEFVAFGVRDDQYRGSDGGTRLAFCRNGIWRPEAAH